MKKLVTALALIAAVGVNAPGPVEASWGCNYTFGNSYGSAACSDDPGSVYRVQVHCIHPQHFNWQQNKYGAWVTSGLRSYASCSAGWSAQWVAVQG